MITKDNNLKVMELFFKYPYREFHIRELARLTGLSSTGIIKIVGKLKKEKLLVSKKRANLEILTPDFEGKFPYMKRLYNLYSVWDSGLLERIKNFYQMPKAIILFGSYAEGSDTEKSDIDLAVVSGNRTIPEMKKFEAELARKINLHVVNFEKMPAEFKNSLANGIMLEGFVEFVQ